jgi:glycogen operon protein
MLTAHDGFTLADVVSFTQRHNAANGEDNRDGHGENYSDNFGVEGPTDDAEVTEARTRRRRNMMATLLLCQGVPMILAGDEIGNSQGGNNNAYCQDNPTGWIDWDTADRAFEGFTRDLIAFRKAHPILRQTRFLHSRERSLDGVEDLFWRRADGAPMAQANWNDPRLTLLCAEMRMASGTPPYCPREGALFLVFQAAARTEQVRLPAAPEGQAWTLLLDSGAGWIGERVLAGTLSVAGPTVCVCSLEPADG